MITLSCFIVGRGDYSDGSFAASADSSAKATPEKLPACKEQVFVREETVEAMGKVGRPSIDLPPLEQMSPDSRLPFHETGSSSPKMEMRLPTVSENSPSETFPTQHSSPSVAHKLDLQSSATHEVAFVTGGVDWSGVASQTATSAITHSQPGEFR